MKYEQTTGVSIQMAFEQFHRDNPRVYEMFKEYTREIIRAGRRRGLKDEAIKTSAKLIINRIRWEVYMETLTDDFKINDAFTSRYARLFAVDFPSWGHLFEFRNIRSA